MPSKICWGLLRAGEPGVVRLHEKGGKRHDVPAPIGRRRSTPTSRRPGSRSRSRHSSR